MFPPVFAVAGFYAFVGLLVLAGVGVGILHLTNRLWALHDKVYKLLIALSVLAAVIAFFASAASGQAEKENDVMDVALNCFLAAMVTYLLGCFLVPVFLFFWLYFVLAPLRFVGIVGRSAAPRSPTREAPRRDPRAEADRELAERRERGDAKRRGDARFEAETLYRRYFAAVKDAFPPEAFEAYLKKYLSDGEPADVIEQRLEKFKTSLLELAGAKPGRRGDPKDRLLAEYQKQVAWIKDAPFEPEVKESMRIEAERRFYERMMEMMGPEA